MQFRVFPACAIQRASVFLACCVAVLPSRIGAAPAIAVQPLPQVVARDQRITLSVTAEGGGTSYQWYRGLAGDTSAPEPGANAASFTTPALETTTNFWVRLTDSTGSTDSLTTNVSVWRRSNPTIDANLAAIASNGAGLYLVGGDGGRIYSSADKTTWTLRATLGADVTGLAYGGGVFVAVGRQGLIATSSNGLAWTVRVNVGTSDDLYAVTHDGSRFVAVGFVGRVRTSTNGETWTTAQLPFAAQASLQAVTAGNGRLVAVGRDSGLGGALICTSTNGSSWEKCAVTGVPALRAVSFGGGRFVAVGEPGRFAVSDDGLAWTAASRTEGTTPSWDAIVHTGSKFVAASLGSGNQLLTSADGLAWRAESITGLSFDFNTLYHDATGFLGAANRGLIASSADGNAWVLLSGFTSAPLPHALAYGAGGFVAPDNLGAGKFYAASAGSDWSFVGQAPITEVLSSLAYGAGRYAGFSNSKVVSSADGGATWQGAAVAAGWSRPVYVTYAGGQFVATTVGGDIATSPDGAGWTQRRTVAGEGLYDAAYGDGTLVVVGGGRRDDGDMATVLSSQDRGVTWTSRATGIRRTLRSVAYGNGRFVATAEYTGELYASTDGATWTLAAGNPGIIGGSLSRVRFGGGLFLAAIGGSDIFVSRDGVNWSRANLSSAWGISTVAYGGGRFVLATMAGEVITCDADPLVPAISAQPVSSSLQPAGQTHTFSVAASGVGTVRYQWYSGFAGDTSAPVAGATAASFTTPPLGATQRYWVRVSNPARSVDSVEVVAPVAAIATVSPIVTTPGRSILITGTGLANVIAVKINGVDATSFTVVSDEKITAVVPANGSTGPVSVSLPGAATLTSSASLTVVNPPVITLGAAPVAGGTTTLSVNAGGTPTSYQWRFKGAPIAGASAATLSLPDLRRGQSGFYDVQVFYGTSSLTGDPVELSVAPSQSPGAVRLDPAFAPQIEGPEGEVRALVRLTDGRLLVGGEFTRINGTPVRYLARLLSDGAIDPTFAPPALNNAVFALAVQSDGRILVGGRFTVVDGAPRFRLARLMADGALDASFNTGTGFGDDVRALLVQSDGRVLVGGRFGSAGGFVVGGLVRLWANGALDESFANAVTGPIDALGFASGGKIVAGGAFYSLGGASVSGQVVARFNSDGTLDRDFSGPAVAFGSVTALHVQPDDKVVIGGSYSHASVPALNRLTRLTSTGGIDATFSAAGAPDSNVHALASADDGRLLVGGGFGSFGGATANQLVRLAAADGARDTGFVPVESATVHAIAPVPGGAIVRGGARHLGRVTNTGARDTGFAARLESFGFVLATALQPDGRIVIAGSFSRVNGTERRAIARLLPNGTLDPSFNAADSLQGSSNRLVSSLTLQGDGKMLIAGLFESVNGVRRSMLARLLVDGTNDADFDPGSGPDWGSEDSVLLLQPDGRVIFGSFFSAFNGASAGSIVRLEPSGRRDESFAVTASGFSPVFSAGAIQRDGRIVLGGSFTSVNNLTAGNIVRLLPDGRTDTSFNPGAGFSSQTDALALQPDGKVVVGSSGTFTGLSVGSLVRLTATGGLDSSFRATSPSQVGALLVQPDGRVLVRAVSFGGGAVHRGIGRLNTEGLADAGLRVASLDSAQPYLSKANLLLEDAGTMVLGGGIFTVNGGIAGGLVRVAAAVAPANDHFAQAAVLTGTRGALAVDTTLATRETGEPAHISSNNGTGTLWFAWTAPMDGTAQFAVRTAGYANTPLVQVYTGETLASLTAVTRINPRLSGGPVSFFSPDAYDFKAVAGTTYRIALDTTTGPEILNLFYRVIAQPVIATPPVSQTAAPGGTVTFSVVATGEPPFLYQWSKDGIALTGATTDTLTRTHLQLADAGIYTVAVTNAGGTVVSTGATLSGTAPPPAVASAPSDTTATAGQTFTFTVGATGTGPLTYQWRYERVPIAGATQASYTATATRTLEGRYDVIVADGLAPTTSASARLSVAPTQMLDLLVAVPGYGPRFENAHTPGVNAWLPLAAGRVLVGGAFVHVGGLGRGRLAVLLANGNVDTSWTPPVLDGSVTFFTPDAAGRILVGGTFRTVDGRASGGLFRLTAALTVDRTFEVGLGFDAVGSSLPTGTTRVAAVQSNGKILVGGNFTRVAGQARPYLARLNPDGSVDPSFTPASAISTGAELVRGVVRDLRVLSDDRVMVVGSFAGGVRRLLADGALDATWNIGTGADSTVYRIAAAPDGKWAILGQFSAINGSARRSLALLDANGAVDPSFSIASPPFVSSEQEAMGFAVDASGRVWFGDYSYPLRRYLADGTVDPLANVPAHRAVQAILLQGDGAVFVGTDREGVTDTNAQVFTLASNGTVSTPILLSVRGAGSVTHVEPMPDGKMLVAGLFTHVDGAGRNYLARLNANGAFDATFDPDWPRNAASLSGTPRVMRRPDGNLYFSDGSKVALLNAAGGAVSGFASVPGGKFTVDSANRIYAESFYLLRRYLPNGVLDESYVPTTNFFLGLLESLTDDRTYMALTATSGGFVLDGQPATLLARYAASGARDTAFALPPATNQNSAFAGAIALLPDGRLLAGRSSVNSNEPSLVRLAASSGAIDSGYATFFGRASSVSSMPATNAIIVLPDGRAIRAGDGLSRHAAANGARDAAFRTALDYRIRSLVLRDDGTFVAASGLADEHGGLMLLAAGAAPTITNQPESATANAGSTVRFAVTAAGSPAPAYQWFRDGAPIPGATAAALELIGISPTDVGNYAVQVSNAFGALSSSTVTLAGGGTAPTIATQPVSVVATAGESARLSVTATGEGLAYQWRRNGLPIAGATNAAYSLSSATRADADWYDVLVSSGLAVTISDRAQLTVQPPNYPQVLGLDAAFSPQLERLTATGSAKVVTLPDNRYYVAGAFVSVDGTPRSRIARFTAAGALDATFTPPLIDGAILSLAVDGDGRVVIAGDFGFVGNHYSARLARLAANGSVDTTFSAGSLLSSSVTDVVALSEGRVIAVGSFWSSSGPRYIARFTTTGAVDDSFRAAVDGSVKSVVSQPDGKLIVIGDFLEVDTANRSRIARLGADGALDASFDPGTGFDSSPTTIALQGDGKLIVGGSFSTYNGSAALRLVRLDGHGARDDSFAPNSRDYAVSSIALGGAGEIVLAGVSFFESGTYLGRMVRLSAGGLRDAGFVPSALTSPLSSVAVQSSGRVLAGGAAGASGAVPFYFARLEADGTVDAGATHVWRFPAAVHAVAHAPGGKIYVAGDITSAAGTATASVVRLNAAGTVDPSFAAPVTGYVSRMVVQGDGKIVVAGNSLFPSATNGNRLVRLNEDGSLDSTFNTAAITFTESVPPSVMKYTGLTLLPGGRVVLVGVFTKVNDIAVNGLAVFSPSGALDATFAAAGGGPAGSGQIQVVLAQPDGKLIVGGSFATFHGQARNRLVRLNANGTLDDTFDIGSGPDGTVSAAALLPDGGVVVGGSFLKFNGVARRGVARLAPHGALDATFDPGADSPGYISALLTQPDGKLLLAHGNSWQNRTSSVGLSRVEADGSYDPSFNLPFSSAAPASLLLLDNGKLLLAVGSISLGVLPPSSARETLVRTTSQPGPAILRQPQGGTVLAGAAITLSVAVAGGGNQTYQWRKDGNAIAGATAASYVIAVASGTHAGAYDVVVSTGAGSVISDGARLTVSAPAGVSTLARLSARSAIVVPGAEIISTFTIEGSQPKTILVRFAGPALAALGLSDALVDPRVTVTNAAGVEVAANDDWSTAASLAALNAATAATGAFPFAAGSKDAALLHSFTPGTYAVRGLGAAAGRGAGLLEIYDADANPRLVYLAARGPVSAGQSLIAGFTVNAAGGRNYLVRGLGPAMGTTGSLANPVLTIDAGTNRLAGNDDWVESADLLAATTVVGAQALTPGSADAALLITLAPGAYSAQVQGAGATRGDALIEIFEVDAARAATFAPAAVAVPATIPLHLGKPFSLGVVTVAKPPGTFQWRKAGEPLAAGTQRVYTVSSAGPADAGSYDVIVTNAAGTITSSPIVVAVARTHSADTDRDFQISLFELTRVIELFNTRQGTVRTGCYKPDATGEDGFAADATRLGGSVATFTAYHAADTRGATPGSSPDGAIDLFELTRVIELYNTRSGTIRTGEYHVASGTEDGFAAGP